MESVNQSAGELPPCSSTVTTTGPGALAAPLLSLALRNGSTTLRELIDAYMSAYAGRDPTRGQRLAWWQAKLGDVSLSDLDGDHIHIALDELSSQRGRYWAGVDADGRAIYKAKGKPFAPATLNRYGAALSAVLTWAIKKRIAPKGWVNPCRDVARHDEHNEVVRFLSDNERKALLYECRRSVWPKLYLFVMLAIVTGARRGELEALRWCDVDTERGEATLNRSKNGDRRVLPLTPAVVEELNRHRGAPDVLVFASKRRAGTVHNHVPVWKKAMRDAGVKNFRFHDLRHSCASYLAQNGATLLEIANVLGHRNLAVTRRYSHLTVQNKADLVQRVLGDIK